VRGGDHINLISTAIGLPQPHFNYRSINLYWRSKGRDIMLRLVLLAIVVATFTLQAEAFVVNHGRAATRPVLKFAPLLAKKKKDFKAPAPPSKAEKQGREDRFDAM
jgi:hypothetical protein